MINILVGEIRVRLGCDWRLFYPVLFLFKAYQPILTAYQLTFESYYLELSFNLKDYIYQVKSKLLLS